MAKFSGLHYSTNYDVIHPETGEYMTQGIQGGDLMRGDDWPVDSEAYEAGDVAYDRTAVPVATAE